jgi:methionyl aminopeptidase
VIIRKGAAEIERIGRAGDLVARTISRVGDHLEPGVTTLELDEIADAFIRENGGIPTSLGYRGYPRAICISVDEVVVHGIPDGRVVEEGDLVTIDVGVTLDGAIADSAYTFGVGAIDPEPQRLLDVCQDALAAGIGQARLGNRIGDISHAVQRLVEDAGFSVVKSLVGHGVGRHYHEDPHVPNFGEPGRGPRLSEGMTIAIEPMITMGDADVVLADDGWTISSRDGSLAAHFEHTVAILPDGPRILTPRVHGREAGAGREGRGFSLAPLGGAHAEADEEGRG